MSGIRKNKDRIYQMVRARIERRKRWYTAEDVEWMNMPLVGREFGSPDYERLMRLEQRANETILGGTQWLTAQEVGQRADPGGSDANTLAARWEREGRMFSIEYFGIRRYPVYAFDAQGQPLHVLKTVLQVLEDDSPWQIASWFESTRSLLGGKRPRELIESEPDAVLNAARDHQEGPQHG